MDEPQVTKYGMLDMQVCVPEHYTDDMVIGFANAQYESGTDNGWVIRKEGHKELTGAPERVNCSERIGYVHIMLEC